MTQVISLEDFVPIARYDSVPWTQARIEEGATVTGPFTALETIAISPVDADPAHPAARSFTTALASETPNLWYQIVFLDASGNDTLPTVPIQNGILRNYATVDELARLLSPQNATVFAANKRVQLQRVLDAAAAEIDSELGPTDIDGTTVPYTGDAPALVIEVNLERAVEHWQQMQSPFGLTAITGESAPAFIVSNTWERHAQKLAPLKGSWGIA